MTSAAAATPALCRATNLLARYDKVSGPRDHRETLKVALDVLRELFDGSVAPLRILTHCFQNDVVQIAFELPAQPIGRGVSRAADRFGCEHDRGAPAGAGGCFSAANHSAGLRWLLLTDGLDDFNHRTAGDAIGSMSREEFVQKNTQRVDVARRSDGLPSRLPANSQNGSAPTVPASR